MKIGIPKETKKDEHRVAILPVGVEELVRAGHTVTLEKQLGAVLAYLTVPMEECGATIADTADEVFASSDLIVKVKEPQLNEIALIRPQQIVFTYFHFAADRELRNVFSKQVLLLWLTKHFVTNRSTLPLLKPMSEVAGRMSIQEGAKYLGEIPNGTRHSARGCSGVPPANVLVLGAGTVGANAAKVAAGFGANIGLLIRISNGFDILMTSHHPILIAFILIAIRFENGWWLADSL